MDLGHPMSRCRKNSSVVIRHRYGEGSPLSPPEGESKLPGIRVEVEIFLGNPDEWSTDVGDPTLDVLAETTPMPFHEGPGDVCSRQSDPTGHTGFEGAIPGES